MIKTLKRSCQLCICTIRMLSVASDLQKANFFLETPVISLTKPGNPDLQMSNILLKLDNLQPSGSFKDRGISHMVNTIREKSKLEKLVCSSGGNAGHAVATVGSNLNLPVDVYVPKTTKPMMVAKIRKKGANVIIHGENWNEADKVARTAEKEETNALYVPPYDDPLIWDGHSSIIDELAANNIKPDSIVLSVGGGGLLRGIQLGLERHSWDKSTRIIAVETEGTASYAAAKAAGKVVSIGKIDSIATSLGALSVTESTLSYSGLMESIVVSDKQAVQGCRSFADEFNMLVEPACGAALSVVFSKELCGRVKPFNGVSWDNEKILVIVCGGSVVNAEMMTQWSIDFDIASEYS